MATAIGATGVSKANKLNEWEQITVRFDDGTARTIPNVTATLRQICQLAKHPEQYQQILAVHDE